MVNCTKWFIQIWSLDGRIVQILDRAQTLPMSFEPSSPEPDPLTGSRETVCVRDVSWSSMVVFFPRVIHPSAYVSIGTRFDERRLGRLACWGKCCSAS